MPLKIVFMGTPDFSVPVLDAVVAAGHEVIAAYTRAPKPAGRGMELRRSPVHVRADALGIPVLTPKTLRTEEAQATFAAHGADVAVVVAYGLILPKPVLDAPRLHCLNLHASLLPRWRGAAPINRAVMAGDAESGVMVMKMEEGLDTGPVALTARVDIGPDMTAGELHDALSPTGAALMAKPSARSRMDRYPSFPRSRTASPSPRRSPTRKPASTGAWRARRCTITCAVFRPSPAPGSRPISARARSGSSFSGPSGPKAPGRPARWCRPTGW